MENIGIFEQLKESSKIRYKHPTKEVEEWEVFEQDRLFVTLTHIPDGELWRVGKYYINELHPEMFELIH